MSTTVTSDILWKTLEQGDREPATWAALIDLLLEEREEQLAETVRICQAAQFWPSYQDQPRPWLWPPLYGVIPNTKKPNFLIHNHEAHDYADALCNYHTNQSERWGSPTWKHAFLRLTFVLSTLVDKEPSS